MDAKVPQVVHSGEKLYESHDCLNRVTEVSQCV